MLSVLDVAALRAWCTAGAHALSAARDEIDGLNVFPVADGDTGTNLLLTMEAVDQAVSGCDTLGPAAHALAEAALAGGRGSSGVLLSQLLRGLSGALLEGPVDGDGLARGLASGAELAYAAVGVPVEGTVLTVARAGADAAGAAAASSIGPVSLSAVAGAARAAAELALARTPEQLPVLQQAGVVDAGGRGWVVLLQVLEAVVAERADALVHGQPRSRPARVTRESGSELFAYEVQYLLRDATDVAVHRLRRVLGGVGDALVVVGGAGLHNVHVHVNDIGAAIEAGLDAGRPYRISVTRFADQTADRSGDRGMGHGPDRGMGRPARAILAVVAGSGLCSLFTAAGASVLVRKARAPATAELLDAVLATGATQVAVLPGEAGELEELALQAAALVAAAAERDVTVWVAPTRSAVQALAALAVADPDRAFEEDRTAMAEAVAATRWGQVRTAQGQVLGSLDGQLALVGDDVLTVAAGLLERLVDGAELVTLVTGAGAADDLAGRLTACLARLAPRVELVVVDGGQPDAVLLLGAE